MWLNLENFLVLVCPSKLQIVMNFEKVVIVEISLDVEPLGLN